MTAFSTRAALSRYARPCHRPWGFFFRPSSGIRTLAGSRAGSNTNLTRGTTAAPPSISTRRPHRSETPSNSVALARGASRTGTVKIDFKARSLHIPPDVKARSTSSSKRSYDYTATSSRCRGDRRSRCPLAPSWRPAGPCRPRRRNLNMILEQRHSAAARETSAKTRLGRSPTGSEDKAVRKKKSSPPTQLTERTAWVALVAAGNGPHDQAVKRLQRASSAAQHPTVRLSHGGKIRPSSASLYAVLNVTEIVLQQVQVAPLNSGGPRTLSETRGKAAPFAGGRASRATKSPRPLVGCAFPRAIDSRRS